MALSTKNYVAIAECLRLCETERTSTSPEELEILRDVARYLGAYFAEDNPNFDDVKFMEATTLFPRT